MIRNRTVGREAMVAHDGTAIPGIDQSQTVTILAMYLIGTLYVDQVAVLLHRTRTQPPTQPTHPPI